MSEEFCDGVKILLKRMESNPEEFTQSHKWDDFVRMGGHPDWDYALTGAEIDALKDAMRKICSKVFTERVMAKLLEDKEEKIAVGGGGTGNLTSGWHDPHFNKHRLQAQPSAYQNAIQPGSWQAVATQTSNTSIAKVLKNKLGIK